MISILSSAIARVDDLSRLRTRGEFRKATRNMMLAYLSIEEALAPVRPLLPTDFALVLGSSHGELETTRDFLATLADQRVARPLLFQNSLHNSTTGFLSVALALTCPSFTVSTGAFTGEDSLRLAIDLIECGVSSACAVTAVDASVSALLEPLTRTYPPGLELGEGAATLVIASDKLGLPAIASLKSLELSHESHAISPEELASRVNPHYDSNGIERVCQHLGQLLRAKPNQQLSTLTLTKPDGRESVFHFGHLGRLESFAQPRGSDK